MIHEKLQVLLGERGAAKLALIACRLFFFRLSIGHAPSR